MTTEPMPRTDEEWRSRLTPEQYAICRCSATEPAFTGKYWDHKAAGAYRCAACGAELFASTAKYDSGSGWPSFWQPLDPAAIKEVVDESHGMRRIEVRCAPGVQPPWPQPFLCINPTYPLPEAEFFAHLYLHARDNEDELIRVAAPQPWDQALGRTF